MQEIKNGIDRTHPKFVVVKGNRLVKTATVQDLKSDKYAIENAVFYANQIVGTSEYVFTMYGIKGLNSNSTEVQAVNTTLTIALISSQDDRIVTTTKDDQDVAGKLETGATIANKRSVAVKDFLKTDKASIFNIKFLSQNAVPASGANWTSKQKATMSEYNKYLGINADGLFAQGSEFVNLNAPENQWIVVAADKNTNIVTFQNRELNDVTFSAELSSTDETNVYELKNAKFGTGITEVDYAYVTEAGKYVVASSEDDDASELDDLTGAKVQLTAVTPVAEAGYATTELDNAGLVRFEFESLANNLTASKVYVAQGAKENDPSTSYKLSVSKEETDAAQFSVVKFDAAATSTALSDTLYASNDYAYWASDDVKVKADGDSIAVVTYAFKQLRADGKNYYLSLNSTNQYLVEEDDVTKAPRFIVKINKNGSYTLIDATGESYVRGAVKDDAEAQTVNADDANLNEKTSIYYDYSSRAFDMNILKETPGVSYTHKPQHVTLEAVNGGYVAMNAENGEGIVAPVSTLKAEYTKEDLTFWLDTLDSEAVTPSFMISKAGKYMYNAIDSLNTYNDATASAEKAEEFGLKVNNVEYAKAIFQSADLTKVEDVENYKFQIVQSADEADEYIIKSLNDYKYVAAHNQKLYFTDRAVDALKLVITPAEAPTSNEGVSATEVKVVAQDGAVVVKNAAGKNVVVSTILGQVVANEVLTSDNATINVPAGIVVVAVEGESFKVNVK